MKCVILAAGYATRLYPLTLNYPKPLLDVNGKKILEWILEDVNEIKQVDEVIIVSNHKFIDIYKAWVQGLKYDMKIKIIDDGSIDNDNRIGAVRDIAFAIEQCDIKEDLMVLAGDNLLDFSLKKFSDFFSSKKKTCIMYHKEENIEKLRKTGVAELDGERIISMEEKPYNPKSNWAVPPFYIYCKEDLVKILNGVKNEVCDTDAPGSFISWFCNNNEVYGYMMPGKRYDIGDLKSYSEIKSIFR